MAEFNVRYGVSMIRPVQLAAIIPAPPETQQERVIRIAKRVGWTVACVCVAAIAVVLWALVTMVLQAPSLAGMGGLVIGLVAFMVWSSRRG